MAEVKDIARDPTNVGIAALESSGDYSAANPESSARGKYQFMPQTFEGVQKNNPDLPKVSWEQFQKSPDVQEQYQNALRAENQNALTKRGLDVTPANEYIMHWAGAPKGVALLKADSSQKLNEFFSENVLKKNRLSGDMSVGDFRNDISQRMMAKMGKYGSAGAGRGGQGGPTAEQLGVQKITSDADGPVTPEEATIVSEGGVPGTGFKIAPPPMSIEQRTQLQELDKISKKISQLPQGSPEFNMAVADGLKKSYGPNWTNAFISAIFGQKDQALTWITGGKLSAPQLGEGIVNGVNKQVWINKNERGDVWFTDPTTGARLPDNTQITATSPEGAIMTSQARRTAEVTPGAAARRFSLPETQAHQVIGGYVQERAGQLPTENALLYDIHKSTNQFSKQLDNVIRSPQASSFLKIINSIKGGVVDESKLKEAAVPVEQQGEFAQYLRNIANLNKLDSSLAGKHAPGAGAHGVLDFEGGAKGVKNWIANRSSSYAYQDAWNNFYEQNKNEKSVKQITEEFRQSNTYSGIENYKKYMMAKMNGEKPDLKDGELIVDYDKKGRLVEKRYNAKTGKVE